MFACEKRGLFRWNTFVAVIILLATAVTQAEPLFSENWEAYTNAVTPYGHWILDKGGWGNISDNGRGGGKCYFVEPHVQSRLRHKVDFSACKDIVLQGWLFDSGTGDNHQMNRCVLGLADAANSATVTNPLIRMGIGASGHHLTYTIVFYDHLQSKTSILVDTKLPSEKGWHFMRLEILHDRTVNYQVWNAAQTIEKKGSFGWAFDKAKFNCVIVGSGQATPGVVGWDDIQAGSLEQIGPPRSLPQAAP